MLPLWCAVILLALGTATAGTPRPKKSMPLAARLDRILTAPQQQSLKLGARVIELPSGRVLYDRHGQRPMIPASNMKLVVMAAAIQQLGRDFKFQTVLTVRDLDLVVIGGGDPTIGDERLAAARGRPITALFHQWAQALKTAGVRQIPGNVLIDDSIFDRHFTHPQWPADQYQSWYEAPIGGLNFDANCIQAVVAPTQPKRPAKVWLVPGNTFLKIKNNTVTGKKQTVVVARPRHSDQLVLTGTVARKAPLQPVTVRDPGLYFGSVLKTVLATDGIAVGGKVLRQKVRFNDGRIPADCHIVAVHRTPLADPLARCGKDSLGMMAEGLFKTLGAQRSGQGTWESGRSAIHAFLRTAGIPANQVTIADGSGLSRYGRLSAAAATQVLAHVFRAPPEDFQLFRNSLATAGTDGTLKKRLRGRDTVGRIFGKTGTINGVRTLAGYIHTHSDR